MIIGPEGDFTKKELNDIVDAGATAVGLGPHRLRVETATMALLSTLMLWSDSQERLVTIFGFTVIETNLRSWRVQYHVRHFGGD
ncbi:ribosomal RNA small subunit methyltransferase E isoform X2 [Olea europaea subsp. europaea]|uniref:16S rRNA (uracil(1498)-N(3))-methyltransferase n=1 Tax=Olea europaea subsp. europaea TaxID=158383 RepID=A0A8S0VMM9_OLEEU|nr:ribosomal RNA small subunit methyltransferase E isoform X2 [Olea europaea subsp. europaea]